MSEQNSPQPLRLQPLLNNVSDLFATLTPQELQGAQKVLDVMWAYFHNLWFIQHDSFDRRSCVKTIEELYEISTEMLVNSGDLLPNQNNPNNPNN